MNVSEKPPTSFESSGVKENTRRDTIGYFFDSMEDYDNFRAGRSDPFRSTDFIGKSAKKQSFPKSNMEGV